MKKVALKKQTKNKLASLKRKAWNTFSKWIIERDKKCVTCGSLITLQAGHYWHNVLDFDEVNINAQCSGCNHFKSGNLAHYADYLIRKHGIVEFQKLSTRHYQAMRGEKRSEADYLALIDKYKL